MRSASVGWQCQQCVHAGARLAPAARWQPGRRRPGTRGPGTRGPGTRGPGTRGTLGATRFTPVVAVIIAVNIAAYLLESRDRLDTIANYGLYPVAVYAGQWYRLVTAAFLHAGFEHILFNMVTLAIVGPPVEAAIGRTRFGVLYMLSALGGSVASYLLSPLDVIGVGASGAIFGVMGAYFVLARRNGWEVRSILALIGINLLLSFTDSAIDWRAHIGGLATGMVVVAGLAAGMRVRAPGRGVRVPAVAATAGPRGRWAVQVGTGVAVLAVLVFLSQLTPGQVNL